MSPETSWFGDSAGGWSPVLSVVGRLQVDGWNVAAVLVEPAVVELMRVIVSSPEGQDAVVSSRLRRPSKTF